MVTSSAPPSEHGQSPAQEVGPREAATQCSQLGERLGETRRHHFAGKQHGNARGVGAYQFGAYPARGLGQRHPGRRQAHRLSGRQGRVWEGTPEQGGKGAESPVLPGWQRSRGRNQRRQPGRVVRRGHQGQEIGRVGVFHLHAGAPQLGFRPVPVARLARDVHQQAGGVMADYPPPGVVSPRTRESEILDGLPCGLGQGQGSPQVLPAAGGQAAAGRVQGGQQGIRGAGGLDQAGHEPDPVAVEAGALQVQQGAARQRATRLVQALHRGIGPRGHGRPGEVGMEAEVRAVGFIDQQRDVPPVARGGQGVQVRCETLVGRADYQRRPRAGMGGQGLLQARRIHRHRQAQEGIHLGREEGRRSPRQHQTGASRPVAIAGQDQDVARADRGQDEGEQAGSAAVDQEESFLGPESLGGQPLGLGDGPRGGMQVIEPRQLRQVEFPGMGPH